MNKSTFGVLMAVTLMWLISGCQSESEDPVIDCNASNLALSNSNVDDASCGLANGNLSVIASGGSGSYSYQLNTGQSNSTGNFTGLSAAVYTVTVDDGECTRQLSVTVNNTDGVIIQDVLSQDSGCSTDNGAITVTAAEGVPPYMYALDDGSFQEGSTFEALSQGTYHLRVTDSQDCEITQEVQVLSGTTWSGDVEAIISLNCALSNCHGGTQPPDFREFDNVQANADKIETRTSNGTMPPTGALSDDLVQTIACWVDDGALNN